MTARRWFAPLAMLALSMALSVTPALAQWVTTYETFYLQAPHNWTFRDSYQHADRLFNAFDYGHAILYETLWTKPGAPASVLEERIYDRLTKQILVKPPHVPLDENAIEPMYAQLAPEAKAMFDWSHILHRQIYDVLADERLSDSAKDRAVEQLVAYYRTRHDLAFSSKPKSMELMQEQSYSLAFRQRFPKFNGLIWGYHWFQVGLYEPLLVGKTAVERQAGVRATVARFWQMLQDPPHTLPYQMPMTAAIAPEFAKRYPEAAIIFDNLHSMHDVVSDILANPSVPRDRKRAEIVRAGARFRDDTSYVMSVSAWLTMSREMGVENMGGPSVNFARALPTPTVTMGAVMHHDRATGRMTGVIAGQMLNMSHDGMAGMVHDATAATAPPAAATGHEGHVMPSPAVPPRDTARVAGAAAGATQHLERMHEPTASPAGLPVSVQLQLLRDPVIRRRVVADATLRQRWLASLGSMPAATRVEMRRLLTPSSSRRR